MKKLNKADQELNNVLLADGIVRMRKRPTKEPALLKACEFLMSKKGKAAVKKRLTKKKLIRAKDCISPSCANPNRGGACGKCTQLIIKKESKIPTRYLVSIQKKIDTKYPFKGAGNIFSSEIDPYND